MAIEICPRVERGLVLAEQIRDRLAAEAPLDERAVPGELALRERLVERGVELRACALQHVREEQLGLEARTRDAGLGEPLRRPVEDGERCPGLRLRHAPLYQSERD